MRVAPNIFFCGELSATNVSAEKAFLFGGSFKSWISWKSQMADSECSFFDIVLSMLEVVSLTCSSFPP